MRHKPTPVIDGIDAFLDNGSVGRVAAFAAGKVVQPQTHAKDQRPTRSDVEVFVQHRAAGARFSPLQYVLNSITGRLTAAHLRSSLRDLTVFVEVDGVDGLVSDLRRLGVGGCRAVNGIDVLLERPLDRLVQLIIECLEVLRVSVQQS